MERVVEGSKATSPEAALVPDGRPAPTIDTESVLADVLADLLTVEDLSVDSHFFDDLGADSLKMAHFCARVRKRGDLPSLTIRHVYENPTIRSLAAALGEGEPRSAEHSVPARVVTPASTRQYVFCGALQLLFFAAYCYLAVVVFAEGYEWISGAVGAGIVEAYLRLVAFGGALFLFASTFPIFAKWILIGRWKPREIQIWSLGYVRFWIVKTLLRASPWVLLFRGSPLYLLYLRALGAKVGRGAAIFSKRVPVCADLVTIGAGTVIRKDAFFLGYRARAGRIETGAVTLGRDVFVGDKTVLDINTSMGDGAQLGHTSALHSGQEVPAGESWHGSPAERTDVNYLRVPPTRCGTVRRIGFCVSGLLSAVLLYVPLTVGAVDMVLVSLGASAGAATTPLELGFEVLTTTLVFFFGAVVVGLLFVATVPRALNLFLRPDKPYPLYGFHDGVHRAITRLTEIKVFGYLFGDSSYMVHYLRALGYKLYPLVQTGANFGTEVTHSNPYLCSVGTGTMVADGLRIINDDVSSTSFSVSRAAIGPRNYLGNGIAYVAGGRVGDNCLLATKAMVPLEGPMHEGVGLLGSPPFVIPRSVERDSRFDHLRTGEALRRNLAAKNRYNLRSMAIYLLTSWLSVFLITILATVAFELYGVLGNVPSALLLALSLLVSGFYFALVERCILRFGSLEPTFCSMYHSYAWLHERLWKLPKNPRLLDGTPFTNVIWRLRGVSVGRRVFFDDEVNIPERTLTTIGDDCVLNAGCDIQCHSQEDGTFKTDRSILGAGCTVGVGATVHYGVTMGDGAELAPDSFLMKGEEVPTHARWGGNPATEL